MGVQQAPALVRPRRRGGLPEGEDPGKHHVAQARYVIDLDLLLTRTGPAGVLAASSRAVARAPRDRALGLSYEEYVAQVVAYLEPEEQEIYQPRSVWETMQLHVVDALEQVGP